MAKGRPRKDGPREPSGRLQRGPALPPAFDQPGLATCPGDFIEREITERGQVVGRTVQRRGVIDRLPLDALDGDKVMALRTFETRRDAVAYPVRSVLDRTPSSGGGPEARIEAMGPALARYAEVCNAMPFHLRERLIGVLAGRIDLLQVKRGDGWALHGRELAWLSEAAACLLVVLDRRAAA